MRSRRFLPSLKLLLAFDAVVRHGSVTAAAAELNLTQSTVSRLILSLEDQLGRELFTRANRRLIANAAAVQYQRDVARALDIVERASMSVVTNPEGGSLTLAVLPTFATRWLGPRLNDFFGAHPGIALNLSTRIGRIDFTGEAFDAAIYYGAGDWPGVQHLRLFDETMTACAAPEFLRAHPVATPEDLAHLPRLQLESRPTVWADWARGQGGHLSDGGGMMMDQFSMMIQAAISGLGVALLPDYLAQIEIAEGRLAPLLQQAVPVQGAYWLVWPEHKAHDAPLRALRDWLALGRREDQRPPSAATASSSRVP